MAIRLFDSLSRELRELGRREPGAPPVSAAHPFTFYNCGPTVYAPAHIGNFRTFVINDVIRRLLELEFGPEKVRHVRNITDVDDKTIRRSREEGRPLAEFTKQWTDKFHADCDALNCLPPYIEPTATGHIAEQIAMIGDLVAKGHAYRAADGSVYFRVSSFDGYGRLSRVKERELQPGAALKAAAADADEKEDGSDFALWKAWKPEDGDVGWDSPWGRGRPGWHIECSAMSRKHLGDTIDLHSGGVDLLFPHHENEIAQSECGNGATFARHWYHSEHLLVDGKKMSKSLGNLYTLDDLRAKGFSPMAVRYALLAGHPRKQLNFTLDSLHAAESALKRLRKIAQQFIARGGCEETGFDDFWRSQEFLERFAPFHRNFGDFEYAYGELRNDLNTPSAIGWMFEKANSFDFSVSGANQPNEVNVAAFSRLMFALGLRLFVSANQVGVAPPPAVTALAERRWAAKLAKDFKTADELRAEIAAAGWQMLDRKDGYKLEPLKK